MPQNAKIPFGAFALYCLLLPPSGQPIPRVNLASSFGVGFSANKPCFLLWGKWHEVPIGDKKRVILSAIEISLCLYVILSVSEISHRTIVIPLISSLRGSVATAAIRWNKIRSIYRVLFQGDRHANARDDTENKPSLREKKNQKLKTRETNGTRNSNLRKSINNNAVL